MSTTLAITAATLGEVLADGDAAHTSTEATRRRANITVAEAEEREVVRIERHVDRIIGALAADIERPGSHPTVGHMTKELRGASEFLDGMHAQHAQLLEGASPAVVAWVAQLEEYVASQPDPEQAIATVETALRQETRCRVYRWCIKLGEHNDHQGGPIAITAPGETDPYLDARLLSFGPGTELIGFVESDLTAKQARQEAAKLRAFADQLEALADTVGGDR